MRKLYFSTIHSISDEEMSDSYMSSAVTRRLSILCKANGRLVVLPELHRLDLDSLSFQEASHHNDCVKLSLIPISSASVELFATRFCLEDLACTALLSTVMTAPFGLCHQDE